MITRFDTIHDVTDSRTDGHTPHNDAPVRRVPVGILPKVRFGVGKIEWCGYLMVKEI